MYAYIYVHVYAETYLQMHLQMQMHTWIYAHPPTQFSTSLVHAHMCAVEQKEISHECNPSVAKPKHEASTRAVSYIPYQDLGAAENILSVR